MPMPRITQIKDQKLALTKAVSKVFIRDLKKERNGKEYIVFDDDSPSREYTPWWETKGPTECQVNCRKHTLE